MPERTWEHTLRRGFGTKAEAVWDAVTELTSLIADGFYPSVIDENVRLEAAAALVLSLWEDPETYGLVRSIEADLFGRAVGDV